MGGRERTCEGGTKTKGRIIESNTVSFDVGLLILLTPLTPKLESNSDVEADLPSARKKT